ncbi:hypothetical protein THOG05_440001 [Vibrio rotiferianus]|nr:hypothetical protein THOG05_440001 [Vibrio rotiferianus]
MELNYNFKYAILCRVQRLLAQDDNPVTLSNAIVYIMKTIYTQQAYK